MPFSLTRRHALSSLAAVTLTSVAGRRVLAQTPQKLRIGVLRLASSGPVFIAAERGYWRDQGIDIELKFFDAAQPIAVAAASGDIDIGVTAFTAGLFNLAHKGALKVVAGQSREAAGFPLIAYLATKAAYEAGLKAPKDLAERTIGMTQVGSSFHYSLGLLARKYGFEMARIHLIPLQSLTNVASALKGGRVEAALLPATTARPLIDAGDAVLLGWVGDETPWQLGAVFAATAALKDRPRVERFLAGYRRGTRDFHDILLKPQKGGETPIDDRTRPLLEMISRAVNLPPDKVAIGLPYIEPDGIVAIDSVDDQIAFMQEGKFVDAGFKAADIIDAGFGFAK